MTGTQDLGGADPHDPQHVVCALPRGGGGGVLTHNSLRQPPELCPSHAGLWINYTLSFLKKFNDQVGERMRKYVLINNDRNRWEEALITQPIAMYKCF